MSEREYQTKSIELVRNEFLSGKKKVLLWLATGSGKTHVFCKMIKDTAAKGKYCIIVVRGRKLVDQASQRLTRENVDHGVLMNNHWNYRPSLPVQVISIDTAISRRLRPKADLIIVDECHLSNSKRYIEFLKQYDCHLVSVTASPYVDGGLRHVAESIVHPISMLQLIEQNYLCNFRYFAPSQPDLTGVQVSSSTKDYVNDQLETAMVKGSLTGKVIDNWIKIAKDRPTLLFAVNIHHSKILIQKFIDAGISAEHIDANSTDRERENVINRLQIGETKIVSNVGIFCTGIDIPCVSAVIMARPTKSRNLFIQQAGRGTRIYEGKSNCILLDHSGNLQRHGYPTDEPEVDLDGKIKTESTKRESKTCKECFCVYIGDKCPECGHKVTKTEAKVLTETDENLVEVIPNYDPVKNYMHLLNIEKKRTNKKQAWVYHKLVDRFGLDVCKNLLPDWFKNKYGKDSLFRNSPYEQFKKNVIE